MLLTERTQIEFVAVCFVRWILITDDSAALITQPLKMSMGASYRKA